MGRASTVDADIVVIGGGIAGIGAAAILGRSRRVVLVEAEEQLAYHATGRSAAVLVQLYGSPAVRLLTQASIDFFRAPPAGFAEYPLVVRRGALWLALRDDELATAESMAQMQLDASALGVSLRHLSGTEVADLVPVVAADRVAAGLLETGAMDIDVNGLQMGYARQARAVGVAIVPGARVHGFDRRGDRWLVHTSRGTYGTEVVINAAGAWADEVATLAGLAPLGLQSLRRTAALVRPPPHLNSQAWPVVASLGEPFYFKPDAGLLLLSPADETPAIAADCYPDDVDVAIAVERVERATTLRIDRVERSWAGLRTFAPDREPVVGFDPRTDGFFWLAGQGGVGIQTAPAMAELCASVVLGNRPPGWPGLHALDADVVAPGRLLANPCKTPVSNDLS